MMNGGRINSGESVRATIARRMGIALAMVTNEATLEKLGVDSLDRVDIVIDIEEELGVEIDDLTADEFQTVGDIVKVVESQIGRGAS